MTRKKDLIMPDKALIEDVRQIIDETRALVATAVNTGLTKLYWEIGKRIYEEILKGERADYGKQILATLSQELVKTYGKGFNHSNLTRMVKFYESFKDITIVATLSQQLSWSHFRELLPLEKPLQRDFYAEMCRIERWSVRTLRQKLIPCFMNARLFLKNPMNLFAMKSIRCVKPIS